MKSDAIVINGLEFYAYHGASDQEQVVGHRYVVDVRLFTNLCEAAKTDRLSDTVSYARVAKRIVEIATSEQHRLLESLASRVIGIVFSEFPAVDEIELRVQKMCPPMNAIVASVGVEMARTRRGEPGATG